MRLALVRAQPLSRGEQALAQAEEAVRKAVHHVRAVMEDLSPPMLHDLGLTAALEGLADRLAQQQRLKVTVRERGVLPPLSQDQRAFLFQAARELLVNAIKHAGAGEATVTLEGAGGAEMCLSVQDQGAGFDPATLSWRPSERGGFGLFNLRE